MENIREKLESLRSVLLASEKEKLVLISTTADVTNPSIIFGSTRETKATISVVIIIRDKSYIDEILNIFDGVADHFLIDCENKNEAGSLVKDFFSKIKKSKAFIVKPNDFTVDSLDTFVALLFGNLENKKVFVIGAGNIGSKITLRLCERGADVFIFDKDLQKTQKIVEGLNLVKRSLSSVSSVSSLEVGAKGADLIIGCTPGIPIIGASIVQLMKADGKIIDAGNRTVMPEALSIARERGIEVLPLSSLGGHVGMIENWLFQRKNLEKPRIQTFGENSVITPGTMGARGDMLVDDIEAPKRVFGVCDGVGGLLPKEEGLALLREFVANNSGTGIISDIERLYQ